MCSIASNLSPHTLLSSPHSDPEVLPLMQDSVDKLLLLLDIQQDPAPIWPALHTLASAVARWSLMEDKVSFKPDKSLVSVTPRLNLQSEAMVSDGR